MQDTQSIGIFFAGAIIAFIVAWILLRGRKAGPPGESMLMLQSQISDIERKLDARLGESTRLIQSQGESSFKIIRDVTEKLTKLDETNRQVVNFADQLQSLQDILKNPKQRGVLGEYYLETVLKNILPPSAYQMQYKLGKNDDGRELIVDAVILVGEKVIPIDSKFSLENYNRVVEAKGTEERERYEKAFKQDLKMRIDETSKYVRPQEGTMDFALMFIPSEAIYYDLTINQVGTIKVNTQDLIQYALTKRVHIVSPNSFYAFLQTILQGLNQMKIEKSVGEVIKRVGELGRHVAAYEQFYMKLGTSLDSTINHYNTGYKELKKIDKDVTRIAGEGMGIDPQLLDTTDRNG
ncbi:MAG: DNA recombination protein RmuC [Candidatus Ryanbacteria bacterium]|nr:DNA recombination protein RmuC [Candidatus Ryanbacteria bacterium]